MPPRTPSNRPARPSSRSSHPRSWRLRMARCSADRSIGAKGASVGEVVFNTSMTGYQEILTDPELRGADRHPHVSARRQRRPQCRGCRIATRRSRRASSFAICRESRRTSARQAASMRISRRSTRSWESPTSTRESSRGSCAKRARRTAASCRGGAGERRGRRARHRAGEGGAVDGWARSREGRELRRAVRVDFRRLGRLGSGLSAGRAARFHVVAYDFGIKHNILRLFVERELPADGRAGRDDRRRRARSPAGRRVSCRTAPATPNRAPTRSRAIATLVDAGVPHVRHLPRSSIARGSRRVPRRMKMKFGHHGANHPVLDRDTGQVLITSQNHGFAVDAATLQHHTRITHVSLFDGSLQGHRAHRPAGVRLPGHPEASPGPHDLGYLFDRFVKMMERERERPHAPAFAAPERRTALVGRPGGTDHAETH